VLIATVPLKLPIVMDLKSGSITVPTNAVIQNHVKARGIAVKAIALSTVDGWEVKAMSDDVMALPANTKVLAVAFRGDGNTADGNFSLAAGNWNIAKNDSLNLNMAAKVPTQTSVAAETNIATVAFTLAWAADAETSTSDAATGADLQSEINGSTSTPPEVEPQNFVVTAENRGMVGYTGTENEKLVIPETVTTDDGTTLEVTEIGAQAFYNCANLMSVSLPASIESIGNEAFSNCTSLKAISYDGASDNWQAMLKGTNWDANTSDAINIVLSDKVVNKNGNDVQPQDFAITKANRTEIGYTDAENLDLIIPETFMGTDGTYYKVTGIEDNAFQDCTNLQSVSIPDTVTYIGRFGSVFWGCRYLTTVKLPNTITEILPSTFHGCKAMTSITIPTSVKTLGNFAFRDCYSLNLDVPSSVTEIHRNTFDNVLNVNYNGSATGSPWGAFSINGVSTGRNVQLYW